MKNISVIAFVMILAGIVVGTKVDSFYLHHAFFPLLYTQSRHPAKTPITVKTDTA